MNIIIHVINSANPVRNMEGKLTILNNLQEKMLYNK
jgi:hypothetical protein